ncbi:MAG: Smr/MutS family protein [Desulfovibrionaceae bacterium]|nr:Smr/MutS family protein [Desulfovibrionaceae bacterium]
MSESNPFDDVNPFLQLKKAVYKTDRTKKKEKSTQIFDKKHQGSIEQAMFLDMMTGVQPLEDDDGKKAAWHECFTREKEPLPVPKKTTVSAFSHKGKPSNATKRQDAVAALSKRSAEENEEDMFFAAMKQVAPLPGKGREVIPRQIPKKQPPAENDNPLQDLLNSNIQFSLAYTDEYLEGHVLGLDLITVGKLQAGQFSPESHLDLHGLNTVQAYEMLVGFFRAAYYNGHRTLLVVPGRGLNSPQGTPVLKNKLSEWLTQEPFRRIVLAFCTAKPSDGGSGAVYVMIRKFRKGSGKVYWDRRPADPDLL